MALKKCIKARIPTPDGWKDVRLEADSIGYYNPVTDYDKEIKESCCGLLYECIVNKSSISDGVHHYEVTWQADKWPE